MHKSNKIKNEQTITPTACELFTFAVDAIQASRANCPEAILDSLVSVDIFTTSGESAKMVVNDFESWEARFTSTVGNREVVLMNKLTEYWRHVLRSSIDTYIQDRNVRML